MVTVRSLLTTVALLTSSHLNASTSPTDQTSNIHDAAIAKGRAYWSQEQLDQLQKPMLSQVASLSGKEPSNYAVDSTIGANDITYKILITDAMGEFEQRSLITSLKSRKDVSFVIKGFLPTDRTFGDISRRLYRMLKGLDEVPNISLDARVFEELGAKSAPVIAAYRGSQLIASASGIANPNWLADQIEAGKEGDLGNFGSVVTIVELTPEEVAAERAKHLDFAKIKQQAMDNYFKNIAFYGLARAPETVTRRFKPVVTVNEPIFDAYGNEIISVDVQHNMLERVPLSKRVVVFDATDNEQMEWVLSLPKGDRPTKYITTRFDNSKKMNGIRSIEKALNAEVYLLNQDVINMFDLRYTPSIVVSDNQTKEFVVSEFEMREESQIE